MSGTIGRGKVKIGRGIKIVSRRLGRKSGWRKPKSKRENIDEYFTVRMYRVDLIRVRGGEKNNVLTNHHRV